MMNVRKIRQLLALVIILASISLAAAIALKKYWGMRSGQALPSLPKNIDLSLQKIHYSETKGGVKKYDLLADKAEYDRVGEVVRLTGIRLELAVAGKTGNITVTADRADYHPKTRNVEMTGHIVAKSASGMEFSTTRLLYAAANSALTTPDRISFRDSGMAMEGTGMEFSVDTKKFRILQQVEGTFLPGVTKR